MDSGTFADSGGAGDSGSPNDGGDVCASLQGTFQATGVACNGTPINITGVTWILNINGSSASFSESIAGCALISSGTVSCSGGVFDLVWSNPNTCNPTACAVWGANCTATPNEWLGWTTSNVTSTTFVATSENEPDGGPPALTTCTAQSLSNPIQITWTKQ